MSKLIINEHPLLVLPSLAVIIGLNEAIILQQVHYWLDTRINNNIINGMPWVYNTYSQWAKQFPFWSEVTIRRTIKSLEDKKLLISDNFNKGAFSNQKWYTINYEELENLDKSIKTNQKKEIEPSSFLSAQNDHIDRHIDRTNRSKRSDEPIKMIRSYIDTKNTTETTTENHLSHNQTNSSVQNSSNFVKKEEREKEMIKIWNEVIEKELGREVNYTLKRGNLLNKRLKEYFKDDLLKWTEFCQKIVKSKFLMGERTDFRVQLDWVLEEANLVKVLEGTYNREEKGNDTNINKSLSVEELEYEIKKSEGPDFWKQIMFILMKKKGINTFNAWLKQNQYDSFKDGILQIKAPSRFFANWQIEHFLDDIVKACKETIFDFKELKIVY